MSEIKVGIIGFDTSHVITFTDLLNNKDNPHHVEGARVVAGFKGGSPDMPLSADRIEGFTKTLVQDYGIKTTDSIEGLAQLVDAILLESVDGRQHLGQFERLVPFRKPVFIDKPLTTSLSEAKTIKELSETKGIPAFSSSSLRYDVSLQNALQDTKPGNIIGAETYGPASYEEPIPGLFWYGIHAAEMLFTAMSLGCRSVRCVGNEDTDVVIGLWEDSRVGTLRGIRKGKTEFGALVFREKEIQAIRQSSDIPPYVGLIQKVVQFFQTGKSPVPLGETVEIMAFLEAANQSRKAGGAELKTQ